jgi:hypothetical protein
MHLPESGEGRSNGRRQEQPDDHAKPLMTTELGALSPELALVDPELAERARHELRIAAAVRESAPQTLRIAAAEPQMPPVEAPSTAGPEPRPARRHASLMRAAAALAVPSIILNVALLRDQAPLITPPRTAHSVAGVAAASTSIVATTVRPKPVPKRRPAASGAAQPAHTVAAAKVLHWKKLAGARMYDVVIWRDGRRVRDVWTREASVSVRSIACAGSGARFGPGSYLWFVYPVQAGAGSKRVPKLAHWGNFRVDAATCSRPTARLLQSR